MRKASGQRRATVSTAWLYLSETWRLAQVNNGEEFWGAIATLATIGLGWIAYRIARFQLEIDSAPVLIPERVNRTTQIENVGRGVAFEVVAWAPDAGATLVAPVLPPNKSVPYPHAAPTIQRAPPCVLQGQLAHLVSYETSRHLLFGSRKLPYWDRRPSVAQTTSISCASKTQTSPLCGRAHACARDLVFGGLVESPEAEMV
jgi:hypothetical protein